MMNVVFALLAKRAFSDVIEGMHSRNFSLAPLVYSRPATSCIEMPIS